jgi:Domain of unknown function (DUF397)
MNGIMWRKSAYSSSNGGNCVEVGQVTRTVAVRDTKQYGRGPVLRFTPAAWRRFTDQVKRSLEVTGQPSGPTVTICRKSFKSLSSPAVRYIASATLSGLPPPWSRSWPS